MRKLSVLEKRELLAIQDQLLEQVRSISRCLEREYLTRIGRREMSQPLESCVERLQRIRTSEEIYD